MSMFRGTAIASLSPLLRPSLNSSSWPRSEGSPGLFTEEKVRHFDERARALGESEQTSRSRSCPHPQDTDSEEVDLIELPCTTHKNRCGDAYFPGVGCVLCSDYYRLVTTCLAFFIVSTV